MFKVSNLFSSNCCLVVMIFAPISAYQDISYRACSTVWIRYDVACCQVWVCHGQTTYHPYHLYRWSFSLRAWVMMWVRVLTNSYSGPTTHIKIYRRQLELKLEQAHQVVVRSVEFNFNNWKPPSSTLQPFSAAEIRKCFTKSESAYRAWNEILYFF